MKLGDLGIVGVGAIAEAIVTGLCEGDGVEASVHLSPRGAERTGRLAERYPSVRVAESNQAAVDAADAVLLSVRPPDAEAVVADLDFRPRQTVISVIAGLPVDSVRALVGPAEVAVRAIPLPEVAHRAGLTPIHPDNPVARAVFEPLGGVIAVAEEPELDTLAAATTTLAAHMTYLHTISGWLAARGIPADEANRFVAGVYAGLGSTLRRTDAPDFSELATEYATPAGFNEQFLAALRGEGTFAAVERALDEVAARLKDDP